MKQLIKRPFRLYIDASPLAEDRVTGIPHFTAELVRALEQHPDHGTTFQVILVIAFDKKRKLAKWQYRKAQVKTIPLPMRLLNLFWKYRLLPPMDVLLGRGVYLFPNYKNWPLLRSYCLTYVHDLGFVRYPQFTQPKNLQFLKTHIQQWLTRADLVLTGSDHARQEIIEVFRIPAKKVVRIYHGVDRKQYYPRTLAEIKIAKTKYGLEGNYLLYVGSLEPRKNLVRLIAAYCELPKKLRDQYALCLAGAGGWLNEDIHTAIEHAKQQGFNVVQPGEYVKDEDLPRLLSGAALLVHPALYEGFGLSPLQAMACGTPALVADNSSLPEVVGKAGILVKAESEHDISAKIEKALTDENYRHKLITRGLEQAQKFSWETSAQELLKYAEQVAGQ